MSLPSAAVNVAAGDEGNLPSVRRDGRLGQRLERRAILRLQTDAQAGEQHKYGAWGG
jgi:hypothetical protein